VYRELRGGGTGINTLYTDTTSFASVYSIQNVFYLMYIKFILQYAGVLNIDSRKLYNNVNMTVAL